MSINRIRLEFKAKGRALPRITVNRINRIRLEFKEDMLNGIEGVMNGINRIRLEFKERYTAEYRFPDSWY